MQLIAYLNFPGTAREAMDFYAKAFGGTVTQRFTYGESPMAEQCGPASADNVMHSQVEIPSKAGGNAILKPQVSDQGVAYALPRKNA